MITKIEMTPEKMKQVFSGMLLLRGVILLIFGAMMLSSPSSTILGLIQFMGVYWIVDGIFRLVEGFFGKEGSSRSWLFIGGILSIIGGMFIVAHPLFGAAIKGAFLVYTIGFITIASGVVAMIAKNKNNEKSKWGMILGSFSIVFGLLVISHPLATLSTLVWIFSMWAIISGIIAIAGSVVLFKKKSI